MEVQYGNDGYHSRQWRVTYNTVLLSSIICFTCIITAPFQWGLPFSSDIRDHDDVSYVDVPQRLYHGSSVPYDSSSRQASIGYVEGVPSCIAIVDYIVNNQLRLTSVQYSITFNQLQSKLQRNGPVSLRNPNKEINNLSTNAFEQTRLREMMPNGQYIGQ